MFTFRKDVRTLLRLLGSFWLVYCGRRQGLNLSRMERPVATCGGAPARAPFSTSNRKSCTTIYVFVVLGTTVDKPRENFGC